MSIRKTNWSPYETFMVFCPGIWLMWGGWSGLVAWAVLTATFAVAKRLFARPLAMAQRACLLGIVKAYDPETQTAPEYAADRRLHQFVDHGEIE